MAEWLIGLKGKKSDLEALPLYFSLPECRVTEEPGGHCMSSCDFTHLRDASDVLAAGEKLVAAIRALTEVYRGFRPEIEAGGVVRVEPDGRKTQFIIGKRGIPSEQRFGAHGIVSGGGHPSNPRPDPLASKLLLRRTHPRVEKALTMFGSQPRTWENLYKVFEIVEEEIGGVMTLNGWVTRRDVERFTQTANHYRHGKEKYRLPKHPMPLSEADALTTRLLKQWLESK